MKAIAITAAAQANGNVDALQDIEIEKPVAHGHDLLVQISAISVNPVDTKVRAGFNADTPRILGWDAVGVKA
ncbi:zinc-binding alcohol dehydrogenase family protein, partial [Escherichia coli O8:H10]